MSKQRYAANTEVPTEKTRAEIETVIKRYGGTHFGYMSNPESAIVLFVANDRKVRFNLPLPNTEDDEFQYRPYRDSRKRCTPDEVQSRWEQACRSRWRALLLVIKAKLEAIDVGVTSFDEEFLAHIVTDSGETVGESLLPNLNRALSGSQLNTFLQLGDGR